MEITAQIVGPFRRPRPAGSVGARPANVRGAMGEVVAVTVVVLLVGGVAALASVRVVAPDRVYVVERLGRPSRTLLPGRHLLIPFVERVRVKVDLREREFRPAPVPVITADNAIVSVGLALRYRILDPVRATYEVSNLQQAILMLTMTRLRSVIGTLDLAQTLAGRTRIVAELTPLLREAVDRWGTEVTYLELTEITPVNA